MSPPKLQRKKLKSVIDHNEEPYYSQYKKMKKDFLNDSLTSNMY